MKSANYKSDLTTRYISFIVFAFISFVYKSGIIIILQRRKSASNFSYLRIFIYLLYYVYFIYITFTLFICIFSYFDISRLTGQVEMPTCRLATVERNYLFTGMRYIYYLFFYFFKPQNDIECSIFELLTCKIKIITGVFFDFSF